MASLQNPVNQNSEMAANTSEADTSMKLLISISILWTMLPSSLTAYFDSEIKRVYHY